MSNKGNGVDVNDMKVLNEDPSLTISTVNLHLRDNFRKGDHVSGHHPDPMRGKTNESTDGHFQDENSKARDMDEIDTEKLKRALTENGKHYRAFILDRKKTALVSRINKKNERHRCFVVHSRV